MRPVIWTIIGYSALIVMYELTLLITTNKTFSDTQWVALSILITMTFFGLMALDISKHK